MLARLSAFVIWALVAATAVFWGLRLLVRAPAAPAYAVPVGESSALRGDLSRLLGAAPMAANSVALAPEASSRFKLIGIVAPKHAAGANGVALIAVDGKIARAYEVGSRLDGDLVLQAVSLRTASIGAGAGAPAITLELPPPTAAATGRLPVGGAAGTPVPPAVPPPGQPIQAQPVQVQPAPAQPPGQAPQPPSGLPPVQ